MTLGMVLGYFISNRKAVIGWVNKATNWAIYVLLFLLGVAVGINDKIINNLDTIGVQALLVTLGAVGGSVVAAYFVYKYFFK